MTCPQPKICGPESKRSCWVCEPDDEPDDEPLVGHTRHPADQDDADVTRERDERGF